jgi:hypothetical protein
MGMAGTSWRWWPSIIVLRSGAYAKGWRVVVFRWPATSWYKILPGSIVPGTADQPLDDALDIPEVASVTRAV